MTEEAKKKYDEKVARVTAATELKEADRVPVNVGGNIYAISQAGYTVAEVNYDESLEKMKDAIQKYLLTYDPDFGMTADQYAGEGRAHEVIAPTFMEWPGRKGTKIDDNSLQQFIEFPVLEDDDFELFFTDRTGWKLHKSMPKLAGLFKPLEKLEIPLSNRGMKALVAAFADPDFKDMVDKCCELDKFFKTMDKKKAEVNRYATELGYPSFGGGKAIVAFDEYSDTLRGTVLSLTDIYDYPDEVQKFIDEFHPQMIQQIRNMNKDGRKNGKHVAMTLHKGIDGFMSDENYKNYYWKYLQEIIEEIVKVGMVPYVFCEGKYTSRLKYLSDIPKGKVIYKFEDTPMKLAKKAVGDVACITGGFDNTLLSFGTVQQVEDACKKMLDDCAPGGGFIFQTKSSLIATCKPENVEAMFRTVREYGRY